MHAPRTIAALGVEDGMLTISPADFGKEKMIALKGENENTSRLVLLANTHF